jgi:hypothetical protein
MKKYTTLFLALLISIFMVNGAFSADGDKFSVDGFRIDGNQEMYYQVLNETVATSDTITAAESGKVFFMYGATNIVMTLPAADEGLTYSFVNGDTTTYEINPNGTETLMYLTLSAGDAMRSGATVGDAVTVYASDDSVWLIRANEAFTDVN